LCQQQLLDLSLQHVVAYCHPLCIKMTMWASKYLYDSPASKCCPQSPFHALKTNLMLITDFTKSYLWIPRTGKFHSIHVRRLHHVHHVIWYFSWTAVHLGISKNFSVWTTLPICCKYCTSWLRKERTKPHYW
jgi:hypothetical protein